MLFQHAHALNGAAAGAAYGILEFAGMLSAFQHQLCAAQNHLRGIFLRFGAGQAAGHAAISQSLNKLVHPCRAAAGNAAGSIDQTFWHGVQTARRSHDLEEGFFFLSGLKLTLFADRHRSLMKYWLGRVRTILLPYILAVAIYYLYFWTHHYFPFSQADFGGYLVRGDLSSHFYFVVTLVQFMVLTPLFLWLARRFDPVVLLPFALGLTWLSSLYLQAILTSAVPGVTFPYGDRVFLSYLIYYLAGCCAGQSYSKFLALLERNAPLIAVLAVLFAAWDGVASWLGFSGRREIPYLELVHTLYILSAILLLFLLAARDRAPLSRLWAAVDRASYLIYLYHCLIIVIFNDQVIRLNLSSVGTELVLRLLVVYPVTIGGALLWQWMMRTLRQHLTSGGRRVGTRL